MIWALVALVATALLALVAVPVWAVLTPSQDADAVPVTVASATPTPTASPIAVPVETSGSAPSPPASSRPVPSTTPSLTSPASPESAEALAALADLETVSGDSIARYYREAFGQPWYDLDRNGCDTRNDVLRRDLTDAVLKEGTNGCKVLSGRLLDPYTGESVDFVSGTDTSVLVQIDHLIPLAWAWRHGAEFWTEDQLRAFANDPPNLRATQGAVNQSKSDSGPGDWMPPAEAAHCTYAIDFIAVLAEWRLGVEEVDRRVLERALDAC